MISPKWFQRALEAHGFVRISDVLINVAQATGLAKEHHMSCFYDQSTGHYVFQNRVLHPVTPEEKEITVWRNT